MLNKYMRQHYYMKHTYTLRFIHSPFFANVMQNVSAFQRFSKISAPILLTFSDQ